MGPKVSLEDLEEKNFLPLPEFEPRIGHPVVSSLSRLRYPDSHGRFMGTPNSRILLSFQLSRPTNAQHPHTHTHTHIYIYIHVVGSKSFRPDTQKPRQMENAVRDI